MVTWTNEEIEELKKLYVENDIPSDALIKDKTALLNFTSNLNNILPSNNTSFSEQDVADKLLSLRKSGKLPRLRS